MSTETMPDPLEGVPLERLRQRTSLKWRAYPDDVLPLWVAEMDVDLAVPVVRAIRAAAESGDTGYPHGTRYAEAFAGFAARRWGWEQLPVERTALMPDVMLGVVEVLRLITGAGDTVIVSPPVYPPFYAFPHHAERQVAEAPLGAGGRLDFDVLEEAFLRARAGGRRAAYLLCNPHNPTGVVHTAAELLRLARLAEQHGVRVIADEIHAPLVLPGATFVPYLSVAGDTDAFALLSASKGWNLPGLKAAVLVAGADAAADLRRMPEVVSHGPSHVAALAHAAALTDGGDWLDALLAGLDRKRALLSELLGEHLPTVSWVRPEASYLAWLDCTRLEAGRIAADQGGTTEPGDVTTVVGATRFFLDRAKVALSAGEAFGAGGAGRVRLNYATSTRILTEAVQAMGAAERAAAASPVPPKAHRRD
ncbi:cystathionine beta-lyase [Blastococcus sp. TBT05-19]|uniref:MalY/PatB family protein n=1 Tax=Blastococcus sp. TBT05-19 TaxID=2250581 RepID=UPI000DEA26F0|nr:aminotransferase class I/II-fold pyridoxal phosphate-dependent enzyme [Blastococcus sp. TBT05-19]RBY90225.1 cystathionine beta-lyase [Blastococcus sp. TBT05-19]